MRTPTCSRTVVREASLNEQTPLPRQLMPSPATLEAKKRIDVNCMAVVWPGILRYRVEPGRSCPAWALGFYGEEVTSCRHHPDIYSERHVSFVLVQSLPAPDGVRHAVLVSHSVKSCRPAACGSEEGTEGRRRCKDNAQGRFRTLLQSPNVTALVRHQLLQLFP